VTTDGLENKIDRLILVRRFDPKCLT